jgi:hypothetical protein
MVSSETYMQWSMHCGHHLCKIFMHVFFWPDDLMQVINEIGHIKQIIPRYEVY